MRIVSFVLVGVAIALNAGILPGNVIKSSSLSQENGGTKTAIDAYSDGAGALLINQAADSKFDNSPMNKLVFKYGEEAKKNSVNLVQQVQTVSTTSSAQEKILAGSILAVVPPSCADVAMSWNGSTKLCEKGGISSYAATPSNQLLQDNCEGGGFDVGPAGSYCASKGYRLPSIGETTGRGGPVLSCPNRWTWTSSAVSSFNYNIWSGASVIEMGSFVYSSYSPLVRCVKDVSVLTCPSGGTLSGSTCTLNTFVTAPGICQSGYTMNNFQCFKN